MPRVLSSATGVRLGESWGCLAEAVRAVIPPAAVDRVWTFRVLRRDGRDWGTAVISQVQGDRRRIFTARFVHTVKGKTRGQFEAEIEEVGSGPLEAVEELLNLVPKRAEDEDPPTPVDPLAWFPLASDDPAVTG